MTPQETQPLQDFLTQLVAVRGVAKDPQAEALIISAVGQQPDAAYLLVQRALLMDQALATAKTQITALQHQIQTMQPAPVSSFLDVNAWGNSPTAAARPAAPMVMPTAPMQAPLMQNQAPAAAPGFFGGGMGNVLGTVAATAAGVAGGAFLFQGIEHLMHPNSGAGMMNQAGMMPTSAPVENTTINNYYGDSSSDNSNDDNQSTDDTTSYDSSDDDSSVV
ncbi:DUF2076 domain-containing protein [Glaciimonas sp. GG7]